MDQFTDYLNKAVALTGPYVKYAGEVLKDHQRKGTFKQPYVVLALGVCIGFLVGYIIASFFSGQQNNIANILGSYEQRAAKIKADIEYYAGRKFKLQKWEETAKRFFWLYVIVAVAALMMGFRFAKSYMMEYYRYVALSVVPAVLLYVWQKILGVRIRRFGGKINTLEDEKKSQGKKIHEAMSKHIPSNALQLLKEESKDQNTRTMAEMAAKMAKQNVNDRTRGLLDIVRLMLRLQLESCSHNDQLIAQLRPQLQMFAAETCGGTGAPTPARGGPGAPTPARGEAPTPMKMGDPRTPGPNRTVGGQMTPAPTPAGGKTFPATPAQTPSSDGLSQRGVPATGNTDVRTAE